MKTNWRKIIALTGILFSLEGVALFYTNATSTELPQTFSDMTPQSRLLFETLKADVTASSIQGKFLNYLNLYNQMSVYLSKVDQVARDNPDYPRTLVEQSVRLSMIANTPILQSSYVAPIVTSMRTELTAAGFIVDSSSSSTNGVVLKGATGPAAITPIGDSINRSYTQYGFTTILDPILSLDPSSPLGVTSPGNKTVTVNLMHFFKSEPSCIGTACYVFLHEESHARSMYFTENGILSLNEGWITDTELAKKYIADKGSVYATNGFALHENRAWSLSIQGGVIPGNSLVMAHGMTAATLELKIRLFNELAINQVKIVDASRLSVDPTITANGKTYILYKCKRKRNCRQFWIYSYGRHAS